MKRRKLIQPVLEEDLLRQEAGMHFSLVSFVIINSAVNIKT